MQDNYNKDLENKGWAQMSALLDKERPVAIPFWKRAWRKLALGLVLLMGMLTAYVYLQDGYINSTTNLNTITKAKITETTDNQVATTTASIAAPNVKAATKPTNSSSLNSAEKIKTLKTTKNTAVNPTPKTPLKYNIIPTDKSTNPIRPSILLNEKNVEGTEENINPSLLIIEQKEDSLATLQIENAKEEKVIAKEPIAQLEQLPLGDFALTASFANIDTDINTPKAKVIENFMLSYDNGYDFGLKNYSSGIFAGLDIPLKNKKWSFRPSLGYNSTRSIIIASQNTQPEGSAVSVNSPIVDTDSEITVYVTNVEEEVLNSENKGAPFFTDYRINELHLQLKAAYRLNDKWSVFGGMTPTYLLNNTQGILPTLTWGAQRMQANFDANQSAVLGVANRINLNGMMGIDYQVVPRFSVSAAYNHGWVKKARTDLIDTKLKSINLSLNYHF